jgi:AbrB family looped-hinge helix DNA binding protein
MATTVTSKGQVTIPKPFRDHLGIGPGSQVAFRYASDGSVVVEKAGAAGLRGRLEQLRGDAGPGLTTDEIMEMTRGD